VDDKQVARVVIAMSRDVPTPAGGGGEPVVDRVAPRRLLVVEDNPINQRVAVSMLEKYGHHVDVAANGLEALAAMAEVGYDVVFMDVQMPEMDGYDATIEQRRRERARSASRTPIVALTAGATRDDLERCMASGMDDVVTKPVSEEELLSAVTRWTDNAGNADRGDRGDGVDTDRADAPAAVPTSPAIDGNALDSLVAIDPDGSKGVLARLAASFLDEARARVAELRDAVARRDAEVVRRAAHRLKGSALYFGATGLTNGCRDLEARGETGDVSGCEDVVDGLGREIEALDGALQGEIERRQREHAARTS
jgi:CheY-like chemotaxis protein/HPt (histidine-containing phosphotransfer) domain-containing protein